MSAPDAITPALSVVICTHNRASYLRTALESLERQHDAPDAYEVLVIDNRSTDDTPDVVRASTGSLPVRHIFEPVLGLCHARNTGWRAAAGRYVAYLDDDAVADPGWLAAVADAFARRPDAGVVGGPAYPIWEAPRPVWLSDEAARVLTIIDWPGGRHEIPDVRIEWLAGTNMAVPRALLERVGGFHPGLDRVGHNMLSSGDVHLQRQVRALGHPVLYEPAMAVGHAISAGRLTREFFRRRYYWQGISNAAVEVIESSPRARHRARRAVTHAASVARSPRTVRALFSDTEDPVAFTAACMAWFEVGYVAGLLGAAGR